MKIQRLRFWLHGPNIPRRATRRRRPGTVCLGPTLHHKEATVGGKARRFKKRSRCNHSMPTVLKGLVDWTLRCFRKLEQLIINGKEFNAILPKTVTKALIKLLVQKAEGKSTGTGIEESAESKSLPTARK